jgi:hypothetical protein
MNINRKYFGLKKGLLGFLAKKVFFSYNKKHYLCSIIFVFDLFFFVLAVKLKNDLENYSYFCENTILI